jgi:ArsR family transcriptional regulator, cadmium/lead-responsive transcriptional repressor
MARSASAIDLADLGISEDVGLDAAAKFFRGLGDPTRLRIVLSLLRDGEQTVGDLVEEVGSSQGRVSSHLACLRWCGYVTTRREGRHVFYSIADPRTRRLLRLALGMVADNEEHIRACHRIDA